MSGEDVGTDLGSGFRKIRLHINSKNKGKCGGARVITQSIVVSNNERNTNLLYIYDKSERSSISKKELKKLKEKNNL
ncbi:MAG: type II toxin-antitoxin system RelE/ParE family toxin [Prevotella sp.]